MERGASNRALCRAHNPGHAGFCEITVQLKARMESSNYMPKARLIE